MKYEYRLMIFSSILMFILFMTIAQVYKWKFASICIGLSLIITYLLVKSIFWVVDGD